MTDTRTGEVMLKLGHKVREGSSPAEHQHTSLYLDEVEYQTLLSLPGDELRKRRWSIDIAGQPAAVDVFEGSLSGLLLLEVERRTSEDLAAFAPPQWVVEEVTADPRYSGGSLARTGRPDTA